MTAQLVASYLLHLTPLGVIVIGGVGDSAVYQRVGYRTRQFALTVGIARGITTVGETRRTDEAVVIVVVQHILRKGVPMIS